jgi:hypothetical protein
MSLTNAACTITLLAKSLVVHNYCGRQVDTCSKTLQCTSHPIVITALILICEAPQSYTFKDGAVTTKLVLHFIESLREVQSYKENC